MVAVIAAPQSFHEPVFIFKAHQMRAARINGWCSRSNVATGANRLKSNSIIFLI
jgi:hypothetical protein